MPSEEFDSVDLHHHVDRIRAGDRSAPDELLRRCGDSLERLAREMMRKFPKVRRWVDPEDILQNASLRLMNALEEVRPENTKRFFGLASEQIRRELLDVARKIYGPEGFGANHASGVKADGAGDLPLDPQAPLDSSNDLDQWHSFHTAVERLPIREREVVSLKFYHGWQQQQIAELFGVDVRTVQRDYASALLRLRDFLREAGHSG